MASTTGSDVAANGENRLKEFGYDFLGGFGDLLLGYGQSKLIDVETHASDQNIPDQNDLVNGDPVTAGSDALGGTYGVSSSEWLKYGAFALAGVALLMLAKKAF